MSLMNAIATLLLATAIPGNLNNAIFSNAFHTPHSRDRAATARGRAVMSSTILRPEVEIDETATDCTGDFDTSLSMIDGNETSSTSTNDEKENSSTASLKFAGEVIVTSELAPMANNDKSLHDFFALPQSAILLMRGSKNNQVKELESIDAKLLKQYRQGCDSVNALPPTSDDRFFEVTTSGVKFLPGLQVMNVATIGVKVTNQELPGYELVFIRNLTRAKGNRLFVWFFDKVTGKDKENSNKKDEPSNGGQTTLSLNKIRVVPAENSSSMISFESNTSLSIQIQFPAILMKAIPGASKEKSEKTGGDTLRKVLEDDCPGSLEAFRQEYVRWLES
eukprot:CAMPEP_0201669452 /NCGR_PEP_ID=MMETSP0494-20130426/23696_1 /ASSEMBLY_ACC=CAM_ASM_000839 /TAXON_ID=420259 /ORGANISM="Thalassiosira gravida, Strain GMp14c1" /LENGTH=334 /DNA_ID=CAMNT_0048150203 /DNA_START=110 /DNA_END=1114 /DNA_ORIENTATION=-